MSHTFTGDVVALAFGGQGIVRHEGLVVFVPFTAVGDRIRFSISKQKKNFATGELVEIISPSAERTTPPCPYFGTCGGCQLQHISYAGQLKAKQQWIQEAFNKIGGFSEITIPPVVASSAQWAYRRKVSLVLKPHQGYFQAGYTAIDNKSLVVVSECPIFVSKEDPILEIVQKIAQKLTSQATDEEGRLTVLKDGSGKFLLHFHFKSIPKNARKVIPEVMKQHADILSATVDSRDVTLQFGPPEIAISIDGLSFSFTTKTFIQSHPEQSLNIYRSINKHVKELSLDGNILDLYCGIGISSLLLAAQGFAVCGVEINADAIQLAETNAKNNQLTKVKFIKAVVEERLSLLLSAQKPQLVILNPPREGLHADAVQALNEAAPPYLIYISCMPPTLARDLKLLSQNYRVEAVEAYDMFPQTSHVETLVVLKRTL